MLGASGSGKSSLVKAGLVPDLVQPGVVGEVSEWRRCVFRPGTGDGDLFDRLARALIGQQEALPELPEAGVAEAELASQLREAPARATLPIAVGLAAAQRGAHRPAPGEPRLVLVLDQLEELFGLPGAERFVAAVAALARSGRVWVAATMRSDFYHRLAELPELAALAAGTGQLQLLPPRPGEIEQRIRLPVAAAGLGFESDPRSGLGLDAMVAEAAARDPGALPLLSFALDELYRRDIEQAGRAALTLGTYVAIDRLEGAIARRAEAVLDTLPAASAEAMPALLRSLVQIDAERGHVTARQVRRGSLPEDAPTEQALTALIGARLVVADGPTVRLGHEALIGQWPRLGQLIEQNQAFLQARSRLDTDARQWDTAARPDDQLLPPGRRLAEADELLRERPAELAPTTRDFVARSRQIEEEHRTAVLRRERALERERADAAQAIERERLEREQALERERLKREAERRRLQAEASGRLVRRTRLAAACLALLAVAAGLFGWFALIQKTEADTQRTLAVTEQQRAEQNFTHAIEAADALVQDVAVKIKPLIGVSADTVRSVLDSAQVIFDRLAAASPESTELKARRVRMLHQFVDIHTALGDVGEAGRLARIALGISQELAAQDSRNDHWGRDLSVSQNNVGVVLEAQGDLAGALAAYRAGLAIRERLAAQDPRNADWQRDLAVSHNKVGDVLRAQGDLAGALAAYRAGQAIRERLAAQDPRNASWQRDLSISHARLGEVAKAQGYLRQSRLAFERAREIAEGVAVLAPLAASSKTDLDWIRQQLATLPRE